MHKTALFPKLALQNLLRNKTTVLPYMLACTVSVFTFYTLMAINLNGALDELPYAGIVKSFSAVGCVVLAIFCGILLFYTNSFLIKRRKKELGLYSILGMAKRNIAVLLFFETLYTAVAALVLGIGLGALLGRLLFLALLALVRFPINVAMPVSPAAVAVTAAFFGAVFLLTLLTNLRQVRLANPVALLAGAKQGEREPKSNWVLAALGVLSLGAGYSIALYFQSPVDALMFFLLAALFVIIGTYLLFTAGSVALLRLLRKNRAYYYQPAHFISVSGMIYRMKQNAAGLSSICILSCMVLVTVSSTVAMNAGAEDSLRTMYPQDYTATCDVPADGDTVLAAAQQTANETGVSLANVQDYRAASFFTEAKGGTFTAGKAYSRQSDMAMFRLVLLADYNRCEGASVTLGENEALMLCTGGSYTQGTLLLDGITYRLRPLASLGGQTAGGAALGRTITLVLADEPTLERALAAHTAAGGSPEDAAVLREISFDLSGTDEAKEAFHTQYAAWRSTAQTAGYVYASSRAEEREGWYATNGGFLFLGVYFGVLFLLAAAMIIYYKQVSEGYDDADRFEILQKVGMSAREVKQTIGSQVLLVFFLPLVAAAIHIAVAFWPVSRVLVVFGVVNPVLVAVCMLCTVLVYAAAYLFVYRRTASAYFKIVRR